MHGYTFRESTKLENVYDAKKLFQNVNKLHTYERFMNKADFIIYKLLFLFYFIRLLSG